MIAPAATVIPIVWIIVNSRLYRILWVYNQNNRLAESVTPIVIMAENTIGRLAGWTIALSRLPNLELNRGESRLASLPLYLTRGTRALQLQHSHPMQADP